MTTRDKLERGSLSSFNVPQQYHLPISLLRLLCLIPATLGAINNISRAMTSQPTMDHSGLFQHKSTPFVHLVALLWCILSGYWSWILTTSMLRRWLHRYELGSAIVRLITLTVIIWSVSAFLSSHYGIDQPIWKWMAVCFIFFVSNVLKTTLSSNKYELANGQPSQHKLNYRSTFVKVLVLPLTVVVFITMFASLYQVGQMRKQSAVLLAEKTVLPTFQKHPQLPEAEVRVMVMVLSAWTAKSLDKRKVFRETTLKLMPKNNEKISYFYRFILGQPPNEKVKASMGPLIEQEQETYGDVLLLPCSDLYPDLSQKVYHGIEWAEQYDFDYFVKTDDDIFVRWDTLSKELELAGRTQRYWRGLAYWNIPPIRSTENKNGELVYPLPIFPPYTAGALYILSRDVVHMIAGVKGPRMFVKNEDQNLGIWLFPFNIVPIHDRRIQQIDVCEEDMIGKHFGDFGEPDAIGGTMYDMLDNLQKGRKMCAGFKTSVCAMCYPCHGKGNHWRDWNFDCDDRKGVTLLSLPQLTVME